MPNGRAHCEAEKISLQFCDSQEDVGKYPKGDKNDTEMPNDRKYLL